MTTRLQLIDAGAEQRQGFHQEADTPEQFPLWMTARQAQVFIGCKTLKSTYEWFRNHGITRRNNGTVHRLDLQRELARPRTHRMNPRSLGNLRLRHR